MMDTLPRLETGIARFRKQAADAGRDPAKIGIVFRVKRHGEPMPPASDGNRKLFSGTDADTVNDIRALKSLGVTGIDFDFEQGTPDAVLTRMQRFRDEVMARV
jgi:hypothetical protein